MVSVNMGMDSYIAYMEGLTSLVSSSPSFLEEAVDRGIRWLDRFGLVKPCCVKEGRRIIYPRLDDC